MLQAPISFADIAREMGVSGFDTTYLENNINVRSLLKPLHLGSSVEPMRGITTLNQRKAVNYGHSYQTYQSAIEAVREYAHCGETGHFFAWTKPQIWRIIDFDGYDHAQRSWFTTTIQGSSSVPATTPRINWRMPNWEALAEYISDMTSQSTYNWNFGFLMTKQTLASATEVYWYQFTNVPAATIHEVIDDEGNIPMLINGKVGEGTWRIIPAWYTGNDIGGKDSFTKVSDKTALTGSFRLYPFVNAIDLTVTSAPVPGTLDNIDCTMLQFIVEPVSEMDLMYQITSLRLRFSSDSESLMTGISYRVTLEGDVWSGTPQVGAGTFDIAAGGTSDHTVVSSGSPFDFRLVSSEAYLKVTLTRGSETRNFTFEIPF